MLRCLVIVLILSVVRGNNIHWRPGIIWTASFFKLANDVVVVIVSYVVPWVDDKRFTAKEGGICKLGKKHAKALRINSFPLLTAANHALPEAEEIRGNLLRP